MGYGLPMQLPTVAAALRDVRSDNPVFRVRAATALSLADESEFDAAVEGLVALCGDASPHVRAQAATSLAVLVRRGASLGGVDVRAWFCDPDREVRCAWADAACALPGGEALVRDALTDGDSGVRRAAVAACAVVRQTDGTFATDELVALLEDGDPVVAREAALVVGADGGRRGLERLEEIAADGGADSLRAFSVMALWPDGRADAVLDRLRRRRPKNAAWRAHLAAAAARRGRQEAEGELRSLLGAWRTGVRLAALEALVAIPCVGLVDAVAAAAASRPRGVALLAVGALAALGPACPQARAALTRIASGAYPPSRDEARCVLRDWDQEAEE